MTHLWFTIPTFLITLTLVALTLRLAYLDWKEYDHDGKV